MDESEGEGIGELHYFEDVLVEKNGGTVGEKPADDVEKYDIGGFWRGYGGLWFLFG